MYLSLMLRTKFIVFFTLLHFSIADYRLIFTHVLYRHGDRSPSHTFPNDQYQEDAWPAKWGQLTPKGVREQYELGAYLRTRYDSFISANYSREEVYVRSSDRDRALESAQSNLAGLYQPTEQRECNAWLDWQPIPIHATAREMDYLLQAKADDDCPVYKQIFEEQSSKIIDEINAEYADLFAFLMNQTGLEKLDFDNIGNVYGPISREKIYGWEQPAWVDQVWNETTGETVYEIVVRLRTRERFLRFDTPEKARLMSGYLLGDILNRMKDKAHGTLKKPSKMVMYSAHDGTLLGLLFAMNVSNGLNIPYAACVIIELHQSISEPDEHFVSIHYRNDTAHDPFPLVTPGCSGVVQDGIYCPIETFEDSVKSTVVYPLEQLHTACGRNTCAVSNDAQNTVRVLDVALAAVSYAIAKLYPSV